jgi:hypothetical protein
LISELATDGWDNWYGRLVNAQDIAALLRPYEIRSKSIRLGEQVAKGYKRDDFADVWSRYLPVTTEPEESGDETGVTATTGTPMHARLRTSDARSVFSKGTVTAVTGVTALLAKKGTHDN